MALAEASPNESQTLSGNSIGFTPWAMMRSRAAALFAVAPTDSCMVAAAAALNITACWDGVRLS